MAGRLKRLGGLLWETVREFLDDNVMRLAAAVAFYSMFSLAPLLIVAVAIAGFIWGAEAARGELYGQLEHTMGPTGAAALEEMIDASGDREAGLRATLIGIGMLLFGATIVVLALKDALNTIWGVRPAPDRKWYWTLWDRFLALLVVLVVGLLLFLSVALAIALSAVGTFAQEHVRVALPTAYLINWTISLVLSTLLFAILFKYLPDVIIRWRDVWVGALITAVLFMIGKELIGLYLGRAGVTTTYGTAGSLAALLIWVYYSSLILLFGAEFTQVFARRIGERIRPSAGAVRIADRLRAIEEDLLRKQKRQDAACREADAEAANP